MSHGYVIDECEKIYIFIICNTIDFKFVTTFELYHACRGNLLLFTWLDMERNLKSVI